MMSENPASEREFRRAGTVSRFLRLIRFSHTIFALPFALGALLVAAHGRPAWRTLLLVVGCMVCARTAAMLFNRLADWSLDQRNPRTARRHLLLPKAGLWIPLAVAIFSFVGLAALINRLTFVLSPVALVVVFFYSLTKRFTSSTHFFLGLALAVAPIGAWIAQTGTLNLPPLVLALAVVFWVAGFDLIYATQDYDFDRREGLSSLVVDLGIPKSLRLAQGLHALTFIGLICFGASAKLGWCYFAAMPLIAATLLYEHRSARRLDVGAVNRAFFQSNAFVSAVFLIAIWVDQLN
jgi:4-hydroxybenzoate polyprenyltransferase